MRGRKGTEIHKLVGVDLSSLRGDPALDGIGRDSSLLGEVLNLLENLVEIISIGCSIQNQTKSVSFPCRRVVRSLNLETHPP